MDEFVNNELHKFGGMDRTLGAAKFVSQKTVIIIKQSRVCVCVSLCVTVSVYYHCVCFQIEGKLKLTVTEDDKVTINVSRYGFKVLDTSGQV